jgi:hypothetical protein
MNATRFHGEMNHRYVFVSVWQCEKSCTGCWIGVLDRRADDDRLFYQLSLSDGHQRPVFVADLH